MMDDGSVAMNNRAKNHTILFDRLEHRLMDGKTIERIYGKDLI